MLNDNFYSGLTAFMRFEAETLHLVASLKDKEKYDVQIAVKNNKMLSELEQLKLLVQIKMDKTSNKDVN